MVVGEVYGVTQYGGSLYDEIHGLMFAVSSLLGKFVVAASGDRHGVRDRRTTDVHRISRRRRGERRGGRRRDDEEGGGGGSWIIEQTMDCHRAVEYAHDANREGLQ